jgi:hypothetical protein
MIEAPLHRRGLTARPCTVPTASPTSRWRSSTACGRSSPRASSWHRLGGPRIEARMEKFCADVPTVLFDSYLEGMGRRSLCRIGQFQLRVANGRVPRAHRIAAPAFFEMRDAREPEREPAAGRVHRDDAAARPRAEWSSAFDGRGLGVRGDRSRTAHWRILTSGRLNSDRPVLCSNDRLAIGLLSACYEIGACASEGGEGCAHCVWRRTTTTPSRGLPARR